MSNKEEQKQPIGLLKSGTRLIDALSGKDFEASDYFGLAVAKFAFISTAAAAIILSIANGEVHAVTIAVAWIMLMTYLIVLRKITELELASDGNYLSGLPLLKAMYRRHKQKKELTLKAENK